MYRYDPTKIWLVLFINTGISVFFAYLVRKYSPFPPLMWIVLILSIIGLFTLLAIQGRRSKKPTTNFVHLKTAPLIHKMIWGVSIWGLPFTTIYLLKDWEDPILSARNIFTVIMGTLAGMLFGWLSVKLSSDPDTT